MMITLLIGFSTAVAATEQQTAAIQLINPAETVPAPLPQVMTMAELEQIALANNPTLSQAAARVGAARKTTPGGALSEPGDRLHRRRNGQRRTAGQQGGFLREEIVTNGKRGLSRAPAGHEVSQAQYALHVQQWRVLNDVRANGYDFLIAQRTVELDDQLVRIGEASMKVAEKMFAAKEVGRVDVLQTRVEANSTKIQLDNARNQYMAAWRKLAVVIGMPDMEPKPLADELEKEVPELTWNESLTCLMAESPELAQARAGVERAARHWPGNAPSVFPT